MRATSWILVAILLAAALPAAADTAAAERQYRIARRLAAEGSPDAAQRANVLYKKSLDQYEAPALDPAVDEALQAFMEDKKTSMPDAFA